MKSTTQLEVRRGVTHLVPRSGKVSCNLLVYLVDVLLLVCLGLICHESGVPLILQIDLEGLSYTGLMSMSCFVRERWRKGKRDEMITWFGGFFAPPRGFFV